MGSTYHVCIETKPYVNGDNVWDNNTIQSKQNVLKSQWRPGIEAFSALRSMADFSPTSMLR